MLPDQEGGLSRGHSSPLGFRGGLAIPGSPGLPEARLLQLLQGYRIPGPSLPLVLDAAKKQTSLCAFGEVRTRWMY